MFPQYLSRGHEDFFLGMCNLCNMSKYAKEVFLEEEEEEERKRKEAVWVRLELKDTFAE